MSERCWTMSLEKKYRKCWATKEEKQRRDGRSNGGGDRNKMADMSLCGCLWGDKEMAQRAVMRGVADEWGWKHENKRRHRGMKESNTHHQRVVVLLVLCYLCKLQDSFLSFFFSVHSSTFSLQQHQEEAERGEICLRSLDILHIRDFFNRPKTPVKCVF